MYEVTLHYEHILDDTSRQYLRNVQRDPVFGLTSFRDKPSGAALTFLIGGVSDRTNAVRRALQSGAGIWPNLNAHGVDVEDLGNTG